MMCPRTRLHRRSTHSILYLVTYFDFAHAHAWGEASRQDEVYDADVAPLVHDVINGRSACVLEKDFIRWALLLDGLIHLLPAHLPKLISQVRECHALAHVIDPKAARRALDG